MVNKSNGVEEIMERLSVSRRKVFALWADGSLGWIRIGRRRFSTDRQLDEFLAKLEQAASNGEVA
ncbi:hypothetical protein MTY66_60360 [Mycolicibacterium sp. TY66]|uniref:hypothetical protein n=1 Tax=Mycobacteriaceae TaxID=1762 RepID=UPI001BB36D53|nr:MULTISPECIES: hypothetical protein [unclassified Mycolicibacterium]BCI84411.1 hypothetical protein MTY66_60360 [Mycolicibacterium sp. TY66]BCJ83968.1 hypothetical protein MTY81_53410 [Mycolicibacterium sp. TY81]